MDDYPYPEPKGFSKAFKKFYIECLTDYPREVFLRIAWSHPIWTQLNFVVYKNLHIVVTNNWGGYLGSTYWKFWKPSQFWKIHSIKSNG